jgi:hypothetical protein
MLISTTGWQRKFVECVRAGRRTRDDGGVRTVAPSTSTMRLVVSSVSAARAGDCTPRRGRGKSAARAPRVAQSARVTKKRASSSTSHATRASPVAVESGGRGPITESYSFFNLAKAEFPPNWDEPGVKVGYEDSPLDLAIMAWFMRKIGMAIGAPPPGEVSYDAFIALCFLQMKGRDAVGMGDVTAGVIRSLVPPGGNAVFKALFPLNKFSCELNASITKLVFAWMVGPMEVEETSENDLGIEMASKVHIKKCRWLQESGCTAMCVNMCKCATQEVFTDDFGLPLTIRPNFEDKSCDFYFGLTPPPIENDEALLFGCNATCSTAAPNSEGVPCHKLRPYKGTFDGVTK